jgi:RNA polymerase sigma factor (sigma-70 family)
MNHLTAHLARHLRGLFEARLDGELLGAFRAERDEAAFTELVRRHGRLVWSACRRLLPDPADAEDAFQATFVVLVRRAHRLGDRTALGPWLYQVAAWTARNMRRRNARTLARRRSLSPATVDPGSWPQAIELQTDLDAALLSLPEKYRTPIVLCHLQGYSRREAADLLGCPEGTLSSLLARGLDRLRSRWKGLDPTLALAVAVPSVPLVLAHNTVQAAASVQCATGSALSATASQLVEGVLRMFWLKKAAATSFALLAVLGLGIGLGVSVQRLPSAVAGDKPPAAAVAPDLVEGDQTEPANELASLEAQLAIVQKRHKALLEGLADAKKKMAAAAEDNDPQARAAAGVEIDKIAAMLLVAQELEQNLSDRIAEIRKQARTPSGPDTIPQRERAFDRGVSEWQMDRTENEIRVLEEKLRKLKADQEVLRAEKEAARKREDEALKRKAAEWEATRTGRKPTAPVSKAYLELTINARSDSGIFQVREFGSDGKPVGRVTFENLEVLTRFLMRTGQDAAGPKEVRFAVQADVPLDTLKTIVDVCQAAGFKTPAKVKIGNGQD